MTFQIHSATDRLQLDTAIVAAVYADVAPSIAVLPAGEVRRFVDACFADPAQNINVQRLLYDLHLPHKTLSRRLSALGLPSPKEIIQLARILCALKLLSESRRQTRSVAKQLGYAKSGHFREVLRQRVSPTFLRTRNPAAYQHWLANVRIALTCRKTRF